MYHPLMFEPFMNDRRDETVRTGEDTRETRRAMRRRRWRSPYARPR